MRKVILAVSLMMILSGVFVYASQIETGASIYKGWNLVYDFPSPNVLSGSLEKSSIKAIYAFIPTTQEYARVYPNPENDKIDKIGDEYLEKTAFWVYSDSETGKDFNGVFNADEYMAQEPLPVSELNLYKGWNFVAILPEMFGKNLDEIKGSCEVDKAYFWNPEDQKWDSLLEGRLNSNPFNRDVINLGIALKVSNDCKLGGDSSSPNPPTIPDSNIQFINQNIGQFKFDGPSGQARIENEYNQFPLNQMIQGDLATYIAGPPGNSTIVKVVIMQVSGDTNLFLEKVIKVYTDSNFDSQLLSPPAYPNIYKLSAKSDAKNEIALWMNSDYLLIVHGQSIFVDGSDAEQIIEDYLNKYPSTL